MSGILDDPKLVRWLVAFFLGIPVAVALSAVYPERQGSQFVPFVATAVAAFAVVALIAYGTEGLVTRWRDRADERRRR